MKPMLACDWDESKVRLPVIGQPKIDGVRALNITGRLTGRSMEEHANRYVSDIFSRPACFGLDGEMAAAIETDPALCRKTTSALNTVGGSPFIVWWVFDFLIPEVRHLPYDQRLKVLTEYVSTLPSEQGQSGLIRPIPWVFIEDKKQLDAYRQLNLDLGYEGTILRDYAGKYKEGRSTVREGGLLRIKAFKDGEMLIDGLEEGQENLNVATVGALGQTKRSTHKDNMRPNGMVGALLGKDVKTGERVKIAAGKMTHEQRRMFFESPHLILGEIAKYKHFPHGVKDKIRFGTFQSIRAKSDL